MTNDASSDTAHSPINIWKQFFEEGIRPNKDAIARVFSDGDVAVLFFEVGGKWCPPELRRRSGNRLYANIGAGTLCFDFIDGEGFKLVPGTLDEEWMS